MTADLDELRALYGQGTDLPWRIGPEGSEGSRIAPDSGDLRTRHRWIAVIGGRIQPDDGRNARLIVAAVNALPDLLAELEAARAKIASIEALAEEYEHQDAVDHLYPRVPKYRLRTLDVTSDIRAALSGAEETPPPDHPREANPVDLAAALRESVVAARKRREGGDH